MKEDVLKIEFIPVFDKWAWKITFQNEDVLKRGEFYDEELCVESVKLPSFDLDTLFLKGDYREEDDKINLCTTEEKNSIEEKVRGINKKYGIKKRWRAGNKESYYLMYPDFSIERDNERYTTVDNTRYEFGNYLKTEAEALEYVEYMKKKSLEWHEKRDNNE